MKVFIVYAHPSEDSFTSHVRDEFIKGLKSSNHTFEISDLYKMKFQSDITEYEYLRDSNYNDKLPLSEDVIEEQRKINNADAIVFIYPVFWTEAPSKLVGWFSRVWTYGYAYGNKTMKQLEKALFLCTAGNPIENLMDFGHVDAMRTVMIGDRFFNRAKTADMVVFDGMSKAEMERRNSNWNKHLKTAFEMGQNL